MARSSFDDIVQEYRRRRQASGPMRERMKAMRDIYEGDVVIPLPELDKAERGAVANILQQGLDQLAMRISSTMPDVTYYPEKPGQKRSEDMARIRKYATLGWYYHGNMKLKMRRRARWLVGYGTAPVVIRPNKDMTMPWWHLRDPLGVYPTPGLDPDCIAPPDGILEFTRSLTWLKATFPEAMQGLYLGTDPRPEDKFKMLEYMDAETLVMGVLAPDRDANDPNSGRSGLSHCELFRVPNRIGICPLVIPARINLGRTMGQFDNALGMYHWQAKLMALDLISIEKGIFPDTYLVSRPNEIGAFIEGPFDGRTGKVNVIRGGDIKEITTQPGQMVGPSIDRLAEAQRMTAGIPSELQGMSSSNIRTGRRGDAVMSAVVDFPIQEAQEIFQEALAYENRIAIAIDKAYFDTPHSFYVNMRGAKGKVDYTPSVHFTSDANDVAFSIAGSDINNLIVGIGQRVGMGLMSRRTGQSLDPLIDDPILEHDRVVAEALEQALLQGLQQQATTGALAPHDLAAIMNEVRTNQLDLAEAVQKVQAAAQTAQATPAPQGAPETMPGLGNGQTAQPGVPSVPQAPQGMANLTQMLSDLKRGSRSGVPTPVAPSTTAALGPGVQ